MGTVGKSPHYKSGGMASRQHGNCGEVSKLQIRMYGFLQPWKLWGSLHITNQEVWLLATMGIVGKSPHYKSGGMASRQHGNCGEVSTLQIRRYGFLPTWKLWGSLHITSQEVWLLANMGIVGKSPHYKSGGMSSCHHGNCGEVSTLQIRRYGFSPTWKLWGSLQITNQDVWLLATMEIVGKSPHYKSGDMASCHHGNCGEVSTLQIRSYEFLPPWKYITNYEVWLLATME